VKVAVYSTRSHDRRFLESENARHGHELLFLEARLEPETAPLADGMEGICAFVNDRLNRGVLASLARGGTRLIALRSAGFNHVDVPAARELGLTVARVPAYSPNAVAEHAVGLLLALLRKLHRSYVRIREGNFSLEGLMGRDLHLRTIGVVGTGHIGAVFARIMRGFGCRVLATDLFPRDDLAELGVEYVGLEELLGTADVIALHCPLTPATHHLIDARALSRMRDGVVLVNTSRGALIDTAAVIDALKAGRLGGLAIDVYEEEEELFFRDLSAAVIKDDVLTRLLTFPNVIVTGHQGFFTEEALRNIAEVTLGNITAFERGEGTVHEVPAEPPA
jgi:D-lactate dehydrogenase